MHAPACKLTIDGVNVTSTWQPLLLQLLVYLTGESHSDNLTVTLDDSYGQIKLPAKGAKVECEIGYTDTGTGHVFSGVVDEVSSGDGEEDEGDEQQHRLHHALHRHGMARNTNSKVSRGSGRVLTISANAVDTTGSLKEPMEAHKDNASFGDVAQSWGQEAGLSSVKVDSALSSIQRPYWAMANETFWAWGARMAREIGATFKIQGGTAAFVPRTSNKSPDGQDLSTLSAVWGQNLLEASLAPTISRPDFGTFQTKYYDPVKAEWDQSQSNAIGSDTAAAAHVSKFKAPDKDQAQQQSDSNAAESEREKGKGDYVVIQGDPAAQPQAKVTVQGIRSGVDGSYTVGDVTHNLSRGGSYTTQMTVYQPSGTAGQDDRSGSTYDASQPTSSNPPPNSSTIGDYKVGNTGQVVGPL
jgi:hypothetical protein